MTNRLSTDDVEEKDRLQYWQHVIGELVGTIEMADYDAVNFRAGFEFSLVGDLKFGAFKGVSQTLYRREPLMTSTGADDYIVVLESENKFVLDHCGHQRVGRGGMVLIDVTKPFVSSHPEQLDVLGVFVPRQALEAVLSPVHRAAGLSIERTQPSFPVISSFLRTLAAHGAGLDPASAARMSSIAVDMIAGAFADRIAHAPTMSGAALLCRTQAYIADHLDVPGLNLQGVAAALNVSVRRLHQVAADEHISLFDWMWDRRLGRAREMLSDPINRAMPVASIGFRCGFVDQAHFSRRFKDRFGLAPTEFRMAEAEKRESLPKVAPS